MPTDPRSSIVDIIASLTWSDGGAGAYPSLVRLSPLLLFRRDYVNSKVASESRLWGVLQCQRSAKDQVLNTSHRFIIAKSVISVNSRGTWNTHLLIDTYRLQTVITSRMLLHSGPSPQVRSSCSSRNEFVKGAMPYRNGFAPIPAILIYEAQQNRAEFAKTPYAATPEVFGS
nr:hypothetical protein CFP56_01214 [Quercus suber]